MMSMSDVVTETLTGVVVEIVVGSSHIDTATQNGRRHSIKLRTALYFYTNNRDNHR